MSCLGIGENVTHTVKAQLIISWDASSAEDGVLGPTTCTHAAKCCNRLWKGDSEGRQHHIWRMLLSLVCMYLLIGKGQSEISRLDFLRSCSYNLQLQRSYQKMVLPASFEFQLNQYSKLANYFLHLRLTNSTHCAWIKISLYSHCLWLFCHLDLRNRIQLGDL